MTPVKQNVLYSKEGIGNGNCLAASLASMLDIPLWMVPPFEQMFGRTDWQTRINQWLKKLGYEYVYHDGHPVEELPEFYIASGRSPRGVYHACVYRKGALIHDPHYSDAGIDKVEYCHTLESINDKE